MKCSFCGDFYNVKKYPRCPKCFPEVKPKEEEPTKITEALNKGQLAMVYGEVEHDARRS